MSASAGNDTLIGGAGVDNMFGGNAKDKDKYVFTLTSDSGVGLGNRDKISGFEKGFDKIDLSQIDSQVGPGGNQAFSFVGDSAFTGPGQVRFFFEGNTTVVAMNTAGNGGAEAEIQLSGLIDLAAVDFIL